MVTLGSEWGMVYPPSRPLSLVPMVRLPRFGRGLEVACAWLQNSDRTPG